MWNVEEIAVAQFHPVVVGNVTVSIVTSDYSGIRRDSIYFHLTTFTAKLIICFGVGFITVTYFTCALHCSY